MFQNDSPDWIAPIDRAESSDVANAYRRKMSKIGDGSQTSRSKTQPPPAHSYTPSQSLLQYGHMSQPEVLEDSPDLFGSCGQRKEAIPPPAHSQHARASYHLSQECLRPAGHGQRHGLKDQEGSFAPADFEQLNPAVYMSQRNVKPWVKFSFSLERECKPVRNYRQAVRNEKPTIRLDNSHKNLDNEDLDAPNCEVGLNLSFKEQACSKESHDSEDISGEVVRCPRNKQMLSAKTSNIVLDESEDAQNDPEISSSQTNRAGHLDEFNNLHQSPAQDQYNSESPYTPSIHSTPESSHDWLGVEGSEDLFSDGSISPELPSREFYLNEEEKIQNMWEKIEQERNDHILAMRISKGMDPFSERSLRSRGKTSQTNTSS